MNASLAVLKGKTSLINILKVLKKPKYLIAGILAGLFILGVILWSLNFDLLKFIIIDSSLPLTEKFSFFTSVYKGIFVSAGRLPALTMIIFAILFAINTACVLFVIRNRDKESALHKSTVAGLGLAIVGGGCIACGTSILAPILIGVGAGGASTFLSEIGVYINLVASIFLVWSIYRLGLNIGTILARQQQSTKHKLTQQQ